MIPSRLSLPLMLILLSSCITQMRITSLEKKKTEVPVENVEEVQIQDNDQLSFIAFHVPGFGTFESSPKPYAGKGGLTAGIAKNRLISADATYLYSLSDLTKSEFQDKHLSQSNKLSRHDLQLKAAFPLYAFKTAPKKRPVLVGSWNRTDYLLITPIQFQNKINLHVGFESIYSVHSTQNAFIYQALNMQKDIFGMIIAQNAQTIRIGLSFTRRSSYQYKMNFQEKLLKGGYFANHEFIAAARLGIGNQISGLDYTSFIYDSGTATGHDSSAHVDPITYLKNNRTGIDFTYRAQYGHQNSPLMFSFDVSAGTYVGYFDTFSNRFYIRLRMAFAISSYKQKAPWLEKGED